MSGFVVSGDFETREVQAEVYASVPEETVREQVAIVNRKLPLHKRIRRVMVRTEPFPRTASGKIKIDRAPASSLDPAKWRHPVKGCSLYWANRVATAFQEKDPAVRDRLLDQVYWDAAGALVPPASPLSAAAALAYAIRLEIVIRRRALSTEAGNAVFDRLTAASRIDP